MKIIYCEPNKRAVVKEIGSDLKSMQDAVGGHIEAVYPFNDAVAVVCNEEGKLVGMKPSRAIYDAERDLADVICGPMFVCGLTSDNFTDIPENLIDKYMELFRYPIALFRINGRLIAFKMTDTE